jgi:hypothetical protein
MRVGGIREMGVEQWRRMKEKGNGKKDFDESIKTTR